MNEKGPWAPSEKTLALEAQVKCVREIRNMVAGQVKGFSYEATEGPRFEPWVTFKEIPEEGGFEALKKVVSELSAHADKLLKDRKQGTIVVETDEKSREIRVRAQNLKQNA